MSLTYDDNTLRQYLLGQLQEEEESKLEAQILFDDALVEQVLIGEDELIEDYLDESLSADEKENFKLHFLTTPNRQKKLQFISALRKTAVKANLKRKSANVKQISQNSGWRIVHSPYLKIAAAIIIIGTGGLFVWKSFFSHPQAQAGMRHFRNAYINERPIESRLTVLEWAPYLPTRGNEKTAGENNNLQLAVTDFQRAVADDPGAVSYHGFGLVLLANKKFSEAVENLKKAVDAEPNNAQLHSDLAAALLENGKDEKLAGELAISTRMFAESLDHINKALELDSTSLPPLFNKALVIEQMDLPQASQAWQEYLNKDSNSSWAKDAQERKKAVDQKRKTSRNDDQLRKDFLVAYQSKDKVQTWDWYRQSYGSFGSSITQSLIDWFLKEKTEGNNSQAAARIDILSYIGHLELENSQDRFTTDLVKFYSGSTSKQRQLAGRARQQMNLAYQESNQSHFSEAIDIYKQAVDLLDQAGDEPEALLAKCRMSHCYALKLDNDSGRSLLNSIIGEIQTHHYGWLEEQHQFVLSYIDSSANEFTRAGDDSAKALSISQSSGNIDSIFSDTLQVAEIYRKVNDVDGANAQFQKALKLISDYQVDPAKTWGLFTSLGLNLGAMHFNWAGVEYHKAALQVATDIGRPMLLSRSHEYLGSAFDELGMIEEALNQVNLAFEIGQNIVGDENKFGTVAHAMLQLADLNRKHGRYDAAIKEYDTSLGLYDHLGVKAKHYDAHKGKLQAYLAKGDDAATEKEVQETMNLLEEYRARISRDNQRYSFFEQEQKVCDLAIWFEQTRMRDEDKAFDYSEKCRARSLLDLIQNGVDVRQNDQGFDLAVVPGTSPIALSELKGHLPEQSAVLEYKLLDDRILIWFLSRNNGLVSVETVISAATLTGKIKSYLKMLSENTGVQHDNDQAFEESSEELYRLLIEPIESHLEPGMRLCIVPDKVLFYLPFGALRSPKSKKYFIDDRSYLIAPSASLFIRCSQTRPPIGEEKLLSVGNPTIDRVAFKGLADLNSAETEAESIASMYNAPVLLTGPKARPNAVKAEMQTSDLIQLALHYVNNKKDPLQSRLVLSKDTTASGDRPASDSSISAAEIYSMDLSRPRLVVLSACSTAAERYYDGEGPVSIARPFLAKGVPLVVATLWDVPSDATAELMIKFHQYRKKNCTTVEALQKAQQAMLSNHDSRYRLPYYWASFIVIGGQADF